MQSLVAREDQTYCIREIMKWLCRVALWFLCKLFIAIDVWHFVHKSLALTC